MPEPELSVIIPCYNEENNVPELASRCAAAVKDRQDIEFVFVDNGSTDSTGAVLEAILRAGRFPARKVSVPVNQGYGWGILSGLRSAGGKVLAWTHADLQTDPADVVKAWEVYRSRPAGERVLVKGTRTHRRFMEKLLSLGMQITASLALNCRVSEINAQPKLFPREFAGSWDNPPHDFSLDLYVLFMARKQGYRIVSIPVDFSVRRRGEAKGGSGSSWPVRLKLIRRSFCYIFELRARLTAPQKEP